MWAPRCRRPLSPVSRRRDVPALLHRPRHRRHRHPEEHGAVQHGHRGHVPAGPWQVALPPRRPRPQQGAEVGQFLGGRVGNEPEGPQECCWWARPSAGHHSNQQLNGSAPMAMWSSHTLLQGSPSGFPGPALCALEGSGWRSRVLAPSKHSPLFALTLGAPVGDGALGVGSGLGPAPPPPREWPGLPAVGGRRVGQLPEGRRAMYNISYLQLAHLPQVFGAAFLPSYLPD